MDQQTPTPEVAGTAADTADRVLRAVVSATGAALCGSSTRDGVRDCAPGSPEEALSVLAALSGLESALAAISISWQVEAARRIRRADADRGVEEDRRGAAAVSEIALARRVSPRSAAMSLSAATRLVEQMPETRDLLRDGDLTPAQARTIATTLDGAAPEAIAAIDTHLAHDPAALEGLGTKRLRGEIRSLADQVDQDHRHVRSATALRRREVRITPLADGMANLTARIRGIDAAAIGKRLSIEAESRRAAGERGGLRALEADALVDTLLGRDDAMDPVRFDVGIVITDHALFTDPDGETALVEGYGQVPAHLIRTTLCDDTPSDEHPDSKTAAIFRRLYTHPQSGELVAMESRARTFPVGIRRMTRWRDATCRTPWCGERVRHDDHIVPVEHGGPTAFDNAQGLCVRCNNAKSHGRWRVELRAGPRRTTIVWNSPHGAEGRSPTTPLHRIRLPRQALASSGPARSGSTSSGSGSSRADPAGDDPE
ncbi:MAG: DUF222 domain-containing protein [Brachybacterium sp.]|nr:DUF222 domain-containing protein [Brachybacterium sp.]